MPIDVAVEGPRARVISHEPNRSVIVRGADAYDVAYDGVVKVVRRVARATDDAESMLVLIKTQERGDQQF